MVEIIILCFFNSESDDSILETNQNELKIRNDDTLMNLTADETKMPTPASPKKMDIRNKNEKNSFCNKIKRISSFNSLKTNIQESCKYLKHNFKITFKLLRYIVSIILFAISIFLFLLTVFQDKDIFQQIIHVFIENIEITNSKNGRPL